MGFFFFLSGFSPYFIPKVEPKAGFNFFVEPGPIFHFFTVYFFGVVLLGFKNIFYKYANAETKLEKNQVLGFMVASGIGYLGGGITFLVNYDIELPQYNIMLMPFYPFLMAYFLARNDLFDPHRLAELAYQEKIETIAALASSVNHEIRNPLYIVKSQAETLIDKGSGDPFAKKVLEQATRAMNIMKRFSSFAKQGTSEIKQERIDIKKTLSDVLQLLSYELEMEKIKIEDHLPEDLTILFDKRHLEQILFNLIRNACQEIGQGGKIEISSELSFPRRRESTGSPIGVGDDNAKVEITISDNGPGIPKERLSQIFEPFYSTKEEGSGVGLYVTRQLIERNGGKISVESKVSAGTAFKLEFSS